MPVNKIFSKDIESTFNFQNIKNSDEASLIFWNWLLEYTRLSVKNAALHDIFQDGSAAFFYDLNDDGIREIIGTHRSTDIYKKGSCYLYILQSDKNKLINYNLISGDLTFDINKPIIILTEKNDTFRKIRAKSKQTGKNKVFFYDKKQEIYVEKQK